MLPISEFLQRLPDNYMLISMRWVSFQSEECKQRKRMAHKQIPKKKTSLSQDLDYLF